MENTRSSLLERLTRLKGGATQELIHRERLARERAGQFTRATFTLGIATAGISATAQVSASSAMAAAQASRANALESVRGTLETFRRLNLERVSASGCAAQAIDLALARLGPEVDDILKALAQFDSANRRTVDLLETIGRAGKSSSALGGGAVLGSALKSRGTRLPNIADTVKGLAWNTIEFPWWADLELAQLNMDHDLGFRHFPPNAVFKPRDSALVIGKVKNSMARLQRLSQTLSEEYDDAIAREGGDFSKLSDFLLSGGAGAKKAALKRDQAVIELLLWDYAERELERIAWGLKRQCLVQRRTP